MNASDDLTTSHRSERGATLVLVALAMTALMTIAAFAVDIGAAFSERREDQNAADAGALAGAVELSFLTPTAQGITNSVMKHVEDTIGSISDSEWVNDCPTEEPPTGYLPVSNTALGLGSATPATRCISVAGDELRVRVPIQRVRTTLAGIIGVDELKVTAVAQASLEFPGSTKPPPFVVPPNIEAGQQVCLRSSGTSTLWDNVPNLPYDYNGDGDATNDPDPCHNSVANQGTGRFGTIRPSSYELNPCDSGNNVIAYGIAAGMDHTPSRFPEDNPYVPATHAPPNPMHPLERQDAAACNAAAAPVFPNTFPTDTGFANGLLTCGLVGKSTGSGCTATGPVYASVQATARLKSGSFVPATGYTFGGQRIDAKPLWEFLIVNTAAPAECQPSAYSTGTFAEKAATLFTCLQNRPGSGWQPADGQIFSDDITQSGRFTFLPRIAEDSVDSASAPNCRVGGGTCVHFNAFVPAFFTRLYAEVSGGAGSQGACDDDMFDNGGRVAIQEVGDGATTCGGTNEDVERVSGIVFHCQMLSTELCEKRPPITPNDPGGTPVLQIRLTK